MDAACKGKQEAKEVRGRGQYQSLGAGNQVHYLTPAYKHEVGVIIVRVADVGADALLGR